MTYGLARRPLDSVQTLRRLNTMLDEAFGAWPFNGETGTLTAAWVPPVDIVEDKDGVRLVAELPGVTPADVRILVENGTLTLRGDKKHVAGSSEEKVHRVERSYGAFERAFTLPSSVDSERIAANYADGVLTITLPKAEKAKPRAIEVQVR